MIAEYDKVSSEVPTAPRIIGPRRDRAAPDLDL